MSLFDKEPQKDEQTARQNAVLAGANRIFREALTCKTEAELGRVCLTVAQEITQSAFGFVADINPETGNLDDIAMSDPGWEARAVGTSPNNGDKTSTSFPVRGIFGRAITDGTGFYTNDPVTHPDRIGTPGGHPVLASFLGVPLLHSGQTIGIVALGNREGGYRQEDLDAVEALAPAIVQTFLGKRAEEALLESEKRLTIAKEAAALGIFDYDLATGAINWDTRVRELWGLGPEEPITSETFLAGIHPDDRSAAQSSVDKVFDPCDDGKYRAEYRVIGRNDGVERWVAANGRVFFDHKVPVRMIGTVQDITERKHAEEALRRLSQFPEENPHPVLRVADDGILLYANEPALAWLGTLDWQPQGPLPVQIRDVASSACEQDSPVETEICNRAGRTLWFAAARPKGETYTNFYGWDITERKQADEELRATNEELARFNRAMVDRELRMIELKMEVNEACRQAGLPPKYAIHAETGAPLPHADIVPSRPSS